MTDDGYGPYPHTVCMVYGRGEPADKLPYSFCFKGGRFVDKSWTTPATF